MKMRNSILAPSLLVIAALASCAQPFKVTGGWNEGATRPQSFKKLLIVGVSPDYSARCNYEYALATTLRSDSVKEGSSHDTRSTQSFKATGLGYDYYGYGAYGMPVIYAEFAGAPSIFSLEREFEIATQLYETRGASVVYSLKTTAKSQESNNIILAEISSGIAARLRQAHLIQ